MIQLSEQSTFIEGLVFRLIKKHIAGTTLNSAFKVTKSLNEKGIQTTITFLNNNTVDTTKARYNLNSYIQLAKQISRLNLKSNISLRLSQLGMGISNGVLDKNMEELIGVAKGAGVSIWIEYESTADMGSIVNKYNNYRDAYEKIGIELPIRSSKIDDVLDRLRPKSMLKLTTHFYAEPIKGKKENKENKQKEKAKDSFDLYTNYITKLAKQKHKLYVLEPDEKTIYKLAKANRGEKKSLIFELPLGYSKRWQSKFMSNKINMNVYVPYGKDWIPYAINKLTEGKIRDIAVTVLDGKKKERDGK